MPIRRPTARLDKESLVALNVNVLVGVGDLAIRTAQPATKAIALTIPPPVLVRADSFVR